MKFPNIGNILFASEKTSPDKLKFKVEGNIFYVKGTVVSELTGEVFEAWQPLINRFDFLTEAEFAIACGSVASSLIGNMILDHYKGD